MGVVLKLCPKCEHHFPTRMNRVICGPCRNVAKNKAQLAGLTAPQRTLVQKLQKIGMGRHDAIQAARGAC